MCGISGVVDFSGRPIERRRIEAMTDILAHRGPDDSGIYCKDNVALGHRRLAIIDLSPGGHQPMSNDDGTIWMVFNGEIYNFQDIKTELIALGHTFKSNSDTEVIIHGYEEWGQACWDKLDGMFALALWDSRSQRLLLVRDPFAIKPLFYYHRNGKVVFASEIKSVLASDFVERELNLASLSNYLTYFYTPGPETILRNIAHVPPGRVVAIDAQGESEFRYWRLKPDSSLKHAGLPELLEMARAESQEAVRKSLVSDVPVGLLLSSGMDSNIILNELIELGYPDIQTITVGFREDSYNETLAVQKRLQGINVNSNFLYVEDQDIPGYFDHMVYHLDSLSANVANMAEYLIVKAVAQHVKVALAGAGNDELFAGYSTYLADRLRPFFRALPRFARSGVQSLAQRIPQSGRKYSFDYLLRKFSEGAEFSPQKSHYWWRTIFTDADKGQLIGNYQPVDELLRDSFSIYKAYYDEVEGDFDFNTQSLYADLFLFCNENANMMVDNLSMAFSLEIRPPFLTKRFVEFAFQVPFKYKLKGNTTKYLLRKAYEGRIPNYITRQRKSGLVSPIPQLIRGPLREMIVDTFADAKDFPYFDSAFMHEMLSDHLADRRDYGFQIYVLFTFMRWHNLFM